MQRSTVVGAASILCLSAGFAFVAEAHASDVPRFYEVHGPLVMEGPERNASCSVTTNFQNQGTEPITVTVNQVPSNIWPEIETTTEDGSTSFVALPGRTVHVVVTTGLRLPYLVSTDTGLDFEREVPANPSWALRPCADPEPAAPPTTAPELPPATTGTVPPTTTTEAPPGPPEASTPPRNEVTCPPGSLPQWILVRAGDHIVWVDGQERSINGAPAGPYLPNWAPIPEATTVGILAEDGTVDCWFPPATTVPVPPTTAPPESVPPTTVAEPPTTTVPAPTPPLSCVELGTCGVAGGLTSLPFTGPGALGWTLITAGLLFGGAWLSDKAGVRWAVARTR